MTGATGLIGVALGSELVRRGHSLVVLVRSPKRARDKLPFPCEIHEWPDAQAPIPPAALNGIEGVAHLAGEPVAERRWTEDRKRRIRNSRVVGTRSLVQALINAPAADVPLRVFVQSSAIGYYGDRGDEELNESSSSGSDFLARLTVDWEAEGSAIQKLTSVRWAAIRTGIVLSAHDGALGKMLPIFEKGLGGRLGSGRQWMSWIHLDDIVGLFVHALENENVSGPLNGVAPVPRTNAEFSDELARALGTRALFPVPAAALHLVFGELADVLLSGAKVVPEKALKSGYQFKFKDLRPALETLFEARKKGLREVVFEQWVPRPVGDVFPFFSSERNLEELTPPFLNFHVVGKSTQEIGEGTLIDYKMKLHGVPMKWQSRIEEWQPGKRFVDSQVHGPYQVWHHTHEFESLSGGTLVRDRVRYKLPLGFLGASAAGRKISRDIAAIFAYRRKKITELFT